MHCNIYDTISQCPAIDSGGWAYAAFRSKEDRERLIAEVIANDPAMQQFPDSRP